MVLLSLRSCCQFPRRPYCLRGSLPGVQPGGVARPGNAGVASGARILMPRSPGLRRCKPRPASGKYREKSIGPVPTGSVGTGPRLDVCARWCPTLPHPGGCSTIGAVRLSFRVRDGCRACPCRCDHRDVWLGGAAWVVSRLGCLLCGCARAWLPLARVPRGVTWSCVVGRVGCGPYSGRSRLPPCPPSPVLPLRGGRGAGGCCLCRPVSTSRLRPLPVLHLWPINPVVCWGPTRAPECPVETLS